MDNPKDDPGDREMTDRPTTGSSANSKISRTHTTVSSNASLPATASHDVLQPVYANEVSINIETKLDEFETDFNKKTLALVRDSKLDSTQANLFLDLVHNTKKMIASTTTFIVDSVISHPDFGLKTINEYFCIKRPEYNSTASSMFHPGSSPNRQLQETFGSTMSNFGSNLKADYTQQFNSTNKKIYICMGVGLSNLLLTAGALTALYLK